VVDKLANRDRLIVRVATNQHGVISTAQLETAGLSRAAIAKRARTGRLHRLHRGVYAVGHAQLSFEARCLAAVLTVGGGAVVSHSSAAALWRMLSPASGPIDVTNPGDSGRSKRRGITIHRSPTLIARMTTRRQGIPITTPKRTLRDLHRTLPQPVYRRAVRKALDLRLISKRDLKRDSELTRSELERLFLKLCRRHRLPVPEMNARVDRYEVDFLWREHSLIVETDSFQHHGHRPAFESDRARDARLQALGYRALRFTYRQIEDAPDQVAATLRTLLAVTSVAERGAA
jgi:very-short-patch-repair endonuclease